MARNILRDKEIRDAITAEQQAHLDSQEMMVPDERAPRINAQRKETEGRLRQILAFLSLNNLFSRKKA
jgi:hypothetical protein